MSEIIRFPQEEDILRFEKFQNTKNLILRAIELGVLEAAGNHGVYVITEGEAPGEFVRIPLSLEDAAEDLLNDPASMQVLTEQVELAKSITTEMREFFVVAVTLGIVTKSDNGFAVDGLEMSGLEATKYICDKENMMRFRELIETKLDAITGSFEDWKNRQESMQDVVLYLTLKDENYFSERDTSKKEVLQNEDLLKRLADEHYKCVHEFGCEREWSIKDACDNEPGIWPDKKDKETT